MLALAGALVLPAAARAQCTPIACGQIEAGILSMVGESDCYEFTAQAGETVSVTTQETAGLFQACWQISGPTGALGPECSQDQRTLPETGTYTITVFDDRNDQAGAYDVSLSFVSDTASNCAEAIGCGGVVPRNIGAIGESDTFRFTALGADAVSITVQETGGSLGGCWELYDPTGLSLGGACGQAERTLAVPGGYTIRVHDDDDAETGTYHVSLAFVTDSASSCAEGIACGQTLARSIAAVGESDTFRFAGEIGDAVSITAQETGGGIGACWELYDPDGISLGGVCGQAERTLSETGEHTIRVHDNGDMETGTYDLHLVFVSDATGSCAEAVACGQPLPRGIGTVGESDTFQFTVESGEALSITTQETAGFVNACWELYDPDGVSLGGTCGQAEKTAAIPGTYTIRVYDNGDIETGTYDLSLSVVSDTASNCAEAIGCGQTLPRALDFVGESDTFRFAAQAGEALSLTTQETGGFVSACWELYDPSGVSLGTSCGQAEKTAAVAGGYTIRVYDNGDADAGTYDLNVSGVSDTASNCAEPLLCGQTVVRAIDLVGESDTFGFEGGAGGSIVIASNEVGGFLNACWELYDPSGGSLSGTCGEAEKILAVDGLYTIRVFDQADNDTGDYELRLCTSTTTTSTITPGSTTTSTTITPVTTTSSTLPPGADDQPLGGRKLVLKDNANKPQKRRLVLLSKEPSITLGGGPDSEDDPRTAGGSLRVGAGTAFDTTYPLAPANWQALKTKDPTKGWKYTKGIPIKKVLVKPGKSIKIVGKGGELEHTLATDPRPVDVVLTIGQQRYCWTFGGDVRFKEGKRYLAKNAGAPGACPPAGSVSGAFLER
jgi:hypothetical protein